MGVGAYTEMGAYSVHYGTHKVWYNKQTRSFGKTHTINYHEELL